MSVLLQHWLQNNEASPFSPPIDLEKGLAQGVDIRLCTQHKKQGTKRKTLLRMGKIVLHVFKSTNPGVGGVLLSFSDGDGTDMPLLEEMWKYLVEERD